MKILSSDRPVQVNANLSNLVDLEKCCRKAPPLAIGGFHTAEYRLWYMKYHEYAAGRRLLSLSEALIQPSTSPFFIDRISKIWNILQGRSWVVAQQQFFVVAATTKISPRNLQNLSGFLFSRIFLDFANFWKFWGFLEMICHFPQFRQNSAKIST